ncbi:MAG: hypothetical protein M3252_01160 [Actinomycetota bacterium]|nr:hypothetical protein [Actinomycetota bacterium]
MPITGKELRQLRRELQGHAPLFEDPRAYLAGVNDTVDALERLLKDQPQTGA